MISATLDTPITIEKRFSRQESKFGTDNGPWQSITGEKKIWAQWRDALPSRSESVNQGLRVGTNQSRVLVRYNSMITADARVIRNEVVYQIVGGPSEIGRREWLEFLVERYTS